MQDQGQCPVQEKNKATLVNQDIEYVEDEDSEFFEDDETQHEQENEYTQTAVKLKAL